MCMCTFGLYFPSGRQRNGQSLCFREDVFNAFQLIKINTSVSNVDKHIILIQTWPASLEVSLIECIPISLTLASCLVTTRLSVKIKIILFSLFALFLFVCCVLRVAWCVVRGAWCVVRGAWCVVRVTRCVLRGAWCVVSGAWCVVVNKS